MVLLLVSDCDMEGEPTSGDQGQVPSSREGTPENWRQIYSQYLEDSPISQRESPKKLDKVDQRSENQQHIQRKADVFFKTHAAPMRWEGFQETEADKFAQWVKVLSYDGHLLTPDYLFRVLETLSPSLDAETLEEVVLGQYEVAKTMKMEEWVRPARMWAVKFFPPSWVDRHLKSFVQGKVLRLQQRENKSPRSPLARGSELEASHSEASGMAEADRIESEASNPQPMEVEVLEQTTRPKVVPSEKRSRGRDRETGSGRQEPREERREKRRHGPEETEAPVDRKRPSSGATQLCPARGCGHRTKYLKDHVYQDHIPRLFHQLSINTVKSRSVQRRRFHGLEHLAIAVLHARATIGDLVYSVNQSIRSVIFGQTNIWGQLQGDMVALSEYAGWTIPEKFEVYPKLNSPASLLYWRVLVYLMDQLGDKERREFCSSYDSLDVAPVPSERSRDRREQSSERSRDGRRSSERPRRRKRESSPVPSERSRHRREQSSERLRGSKKSSERPRLRRHSLEKEVEEGRNRSVQFDYFHQIRVQLPSGSRDDSSVVESLNPAAFDSHFHLDRTISKLWENRQDHARVQVEDVLKFRLKMEPRNPVELVGGVMVFCDPENIASIPLADGKWKIAVGVHPRKAVGCPETILSRIKILVDTNPLVKALGEIGLDRTEPDYTWPDQDRMFKKLLSWSRPEKVLVLHLRGVSDRDCSDVLLAGLHYVKKACYSNQLIHLHCFTGNQAMVEYWLEDFPNVYFGFTARVTSFNTEQIDGLRAVPTNRLLLETDSPYMPVEGQNRVNTPAYIGDVGEVVARVRGMPLRELLETTLENGIRLYQ